MYKYNREQSFHCFIYIQHGTLDTEYRVVETQLEDKLPIFMAMGDSLLRITINRGGAETSSSTSARFPHQEGEV
jgi:hypothetical protein